MEADPRERLHLLVDTLPAGELPVSECCPEFLAISGHPFVRALFAAPEADEPLSGGNRDAPDKGCRAR